MRTRKALTISQSPEDVEHLKRLAALWGMGPSRAVAQAVTNALAMAEAGLPIHSTVKAQTTTDPQNPGPRP